MAFKRCVKMNWKRRYSRFVFDWHLHLCLWDIWRRLRGHFEKRRTEAWHHPERYAKVAREVENQIYHSTLLTKYLTLEGYLRTIGLHLKDPKRKQSQTGHTDSMYFDTSNTLEIFDVQLLVLSEVPCDWEEVMWQGMTFSELVLHEALPTA